MGTGNSKSDESKRLFRNNRRSGSEQFSGSRQSSNSSVASFVNYITGENKPSSNARADSGSNVTSLQRPWARLRGDTSFLFPDRVNGKVQPEFYRSWALPMSYPG